MAELREVKVLRIKLKAARTMLRELSILVAQAEEALEAAAEEENPQPKEAQGNGNVRFVEDVKRHAQSRVQVVVARSTA